MRNSPARLFDHHGRMHNYLRISLTEKCNLRCSYCMPPEGVQLTPKNELMSADEIVDIAKSFVGMGVDKIRLTGGEPLVRKDFKDILYALSKLPITLSLTTNAILIDRYIDDLKACGIEGINVSLDSLNAENFKQLTKRDSFQKAYDNILLLLSHGFKVKLNVVLIKGTNDSEIIDFIRFSADHSVSVRFIEFMPFDGNQWDRSKLVLQKEIMDKAHDAFGIKNILALEPEKNFVSRNYKLIGAKGDFGIISTVSNPFCDGCNRIRLTANGKIKNCLFSDTEMDLLTAYRTGNDIEPLIRQALGQKKPVRSGMDSFEKLADPKEHTKNRSMITIGG